MNIIKEMESYAQLNHIPIMEKAGIEYLCEFIRKHEVKRILEIGTAIGYSAIRMATVNETVEVVSIERDDQRYKLAQENIRKVLIFKTSRKDTSPLTYEINGDTAFKIDKALSTCKILENEIMQMEYRIIFSLSCQYTNPHSFLGFLVCRYYSQPIVAKLKK